MKSKFNPQLIVENSLSSSAMLGRLAGMFKGKSEEGALLKVRRHPLGAASRHSRFLRQSAVQQPRQEVPGDCLITWSILQELVPGMFLLPVLQHQIPIKLF